MIGKAILFTQAHPIVSAMIVCYLMTFLAVRKYKPFLPHFKLNIAWLPNYLRERLVLIGAVFVMGVSVSMIVTIGLIIFACCGLTWPQAIYTALSVGALAPLVYDMVIGMLSLAEIFNLLSRKSRIAIEKIIDPTREPRKSNKAPKRDRRDAE